MLKPGDTAPDFEAVDCYGKSVSLMQFRGKRLIVFFFPKVFTPGCTAEVRKFRDNHQKISDLNAELIGISVDAPDRSCRFSESEGLKFTLIGDESRTISERFGVVWPILKIDRRATFVIDEHGIITDVFHHEVQIDKHLADVLARLSRTRTAAIACLMAALALMPVAAWAQSTDAGPTPDASVGSGGVDRETEEGDEGGGTCLFDRDCDRGYRCANQRCVYQPDRDATATGCEVTGAGLTIAASWLWIRTRRRSKRPIS